MIEQVGAAGYGHYEISNFCLPGFQSRHNTKYWNARRTLVLAVRRIHYDGARRRWANQREVAKYVELIETKQASVVERTDLKEEDARSESIFLGCV